MDYSIPNVILIGRLGYPLYRFDNSRISVGSVSGVFSVDTIGNELSVDVFSFRVRYDQTSQIYAPVGADAYELTGGAIYTLKTKAGRDYLMELPYGTPVFWYVNGVFAAKAYLQTVERLTKYEWKISCISGVGLLGDSYHPGGIYNRALLGDIAMDIIGDSFPVRIDQAVASVIVTGWLQYDTRRKNLQRLLFATGASLLRDAASTDYRIGFIEALDDPPAIGPERVSVSGSTHYSLPATAVEVTEHRFFQGSGTAAEVLFDNTGGEAVSELTVTFSGPHYDLAATGGLTVHESGVNYAVVSGIGALTGKPYTHTTQLVGLGQDKRLTKKVNADNCLISMLNSRNVAKKVLAYYQQAKTIGARLLADGEKCGHLYRITDAFGDPSTAFLQKLTLTPTGLMAASAEFVEGYTPTGQGNYYKNRIVVTETGDVQLPAGVTHIRLLLMSGGDGGSGGYDGEGSYTGDIGYYIRTDADGQRYYGLGYTGPEFTPDGGDSGKPGSAGRILMVDLDVTDGETLHFEIGTAGTGGARNGEEGTAGTATTVSSPSAGFLTSADGELYDGFADPLTGEIYGKPGARGSSGANGGRTEFYGTSSFGGQPGGDRGEHSGGAGGAGTKAAGYPSPYGAYGGGGGGASQGADGEDGGDASVTESAGTKILQGGAAGDGADATAPEKPTFGCGGAAGNGGGAAGNPGGSRYWEDAQGSFSLRMGATGVGGKGSVGGDGGDAAGMIYY